MRPITNSVPIEKISTPGSRPMLPAPLPTVALLSHHATPILPVCRCPRAMQFLGSTPVDLVSPSKTPPIPTFHPSSPPSPLKAYPLCIRVNVRQHQEIGR